jgi:hypothetical protein
MGWQAGLANLLNEYSRLLPPAAFAEQLVAVAEQLIYRKGEHEYALRVCIERYLSSVVPDGVQGGGRGVISPAVAALRAKHIDDKSRQARKLGPDSILTLRALGAAAVCIFERALQIDPTCVTDSTAEALTESCRLTQQMMEIAQCDDSAA